MPICRAFARICLFSFLAVAYSAAQAPDGIPRNLARLRAQQLKDVRYQLSYNIRPKADSITGHEELRFVQNPDDHSSKPKPDSLGAPADDRGILPEWLDFREGSISVLMINGHAAPPTIQNGHIELPAKFLRLGENVVEIDFIAP